jgi:putative glutathione S-transferase
MTTQSSIHNPATADGWHGVIPSEEFPAEKGRYHLYIGLFCPFAHRANFVRHLKGLTDFIDVSIVKPYPKGDAKGWPGWRFPASDDEYPGATVDRLFGEDYLHKVYFRADPDYKGRYSVPLLWDKKTGTAVCNVRTSLTSSHINILTEFVIRKVPNFFDGYPRHSMSYSRHRSP